ncbi:hypothetical protein ACO0QE_004700 [Hanseniaspora vineae]
MIHHLAPWVPPFIQSLKNHTSGPFLPFQISTLRTVHDEDSASSSDEDIDSDSDNASVHSKVNKTKASKPVIVRPSCRTVVFRDFLFNDKKSNILTYVTDLRSEKIQDIKDNGGVFEACFYFPDTMEQYRFSGSTQVVISLETLSTLSHDPAVINNLVVSPSICGGHTKSVLKKMEALLKQKEKCKTGNNVNGTLQTNGVGAEATTKTSSTEHNDDEQHSDTESLDEQIYEVTEDLEENKDIDIDAYAPPTEREWFLELQRHWMNLSKTSKSQYRKPEPGLRINDELEKKLDKINRGVDGQTEEVGLPNFGIVCLIIDKVDYLNLKNNGNRGERWLYKKDIYQGENGECYEEMWDEEEVCP